MRPLRGSIEVIPDKSLTHRAVLLALAAEGESVVQSPNVGADCRSTLRAAEALGAQVDEQEDTWRIQSLGKLTEPDDVLDLGNSGTGFRLLLGLLAAQPFYSVLTGDGSLRRRPMHRVMEPLARMGAELRARDGGRAPVSIRGAKLTGIDYRMPVASAQVKSSLLLAALALEAGELALSEPARSRDHTERLLEWLGAPISRDGLRIRLAAGTRLRPFRYRVPGDASAAAFFAVGAAVTPGSRVELLRVGLNPTRTGAFRVLERMGAKLSLDSDAVDGPEPTGTIRVETSELRATDVAGDEVPLLIDEIPILAVAASAANGRSSFRDLAELKVKESDRLRSTVDLLRTLGTQVEEFPDGFAVTGPTRWKAGTVRTHDDHRIAMSALIASAACDAEIRVDSEAMIGTSDPTFHARLGALQGQTDG